MTQLTHAISLTGSVALVTEYLGFAINNILFQRGVYPSDNFEQVKKYGLPLMISTNTDLNAYLAELLQQISAWIARGTCKRVVLLILNTPCTEARERWEFEVETETGLASGPRASRHSEEETRREIQLVLRQITSCMSFLPVLEDSLDFDVNVYLTTDALVPPTKWTPGEAQMLNRGATMVRLRTFATPFHLVQTNVTYRD